MSAVNIRLAILHLIMALLLGVVLASLNGVLKLVVMPYLAYLLYEKRPEHFPALVVLMSYGTILTIAGGVLIIPIAVRSLWKIEDAFISRFLKLLLLMLPVYVVITVMRMGSGTAFTDALIMNNYYIAFWFLLYGVIIRTIQPSKPRLFHYFWAITIFDIANRAWRCRSIWSIV